MKDERIREIADEGLRMTADGTEEFFAFTFAIQTALAERDLEVAEWASELLEYCKLNAAKALTANDQERQMARAAVLEGLLAFLEAQP